MFLDMAFQSLSTQFFSPSFPKYYCVIEDRLWEGRNEVKWCPLLGVRSKFDSPTFETEVFRKQIYGIKESACDTVGTFRRPPQ